MDFETRPRVPNLPPSVEIREARPADGPPLVRAIEQTNLETDYLGEPGEAVRWAGRVEQQIEEMRARDTGVYFLACRGGDIVGFLGAFAGELRRTRSVVLVAHVGVRAADRGCGIGARLLAAIESWARDRQARRLELRVDEANAPALALYRRRGFRLEGRIVDAVRLNGRWHAHHLMGLLLSDRAEPACRATELPRSLAAPALGDVTFRTPHCGDAARLQAFEWELLTVSPFHLKLPAEVADVSDICADLAAAAQNPMRFTLAAFAGAERTRQIVVGCVQAWLAPAARMRHDALFALDVLPSHGGRGVGRTLAQALEAWARERGLHRLTTWTPAHNAGGLPSD